MKTFKSQLSGKEYAISERISGEIVRNSILALIQKDYPAFTANQYLSVSELNFYREKYISDYLQQQVGELTALEKTVLETITEHDTLADKVDEDSAVLTFGQRVADKVATFGGSWTFILSFGGFLFIWIGCNVLFLHNRGFDPYPFILLNLLLSCLAALQAPIIMMSQNRQEEKDRERSKKDYMVNLKSELELRILHEKLDHLIMHQQQQLLQIQKIQIDMMNDILRQVDRNSGHRPL